MSLKKPNQTKPLFLKNASTILYIWQLIYIKIALKWMLQELYSTNNPLSRFQENANWITAEDECHWYDIKQSDHEDPVMLEFWGMQSTPSLPTLPGTLVLIRSDLSVK